VVVAERGRLLEETPVLADLASDREHPHRDDRRDDRHAEQDERGDLRARAAADPVARPDRVTEEGGDRVAAAEAGPLVTPVAEVVDAAGGDRGRGAAGERGAAHRTVGHATRSSSLKSSSRWRRRGSSRTSASPS